MGWLDSIAQLASAYGAAKGGGQQDQATPMPTVSRVQQPGWGNQVPGSRRVPPTPGTGTGTGLYGQPGTAADYGNAAKFEKTFMAPAFWGNQPGTAGTPWLTKVLSDPYGVSEAPLRGQLENVNTAFNVAQNRMRNANLDAGLGGGIGPEGNVARAGAGNSEMGRAAQIASILRDWAAFQQKTGDERLSQLYLPWMGLYQGARNQGQGAKEYAQTRQDKIDASKPGIGDYIKGAAQIASAIGEGGGWTDIVKGLSNFFG